MSCMEFSGTVWHHGGLRGAQAPRNHIGMSRTGGGCELRLACRGGGWGKEAKQRPRIGDAMGMRCSHSIRVAHCNKRGAVCRFRTPIRPYLALEIHRGGLQHCRKPAVVSLRWMGSRGCHPVWGGTVLYAILQDLGRWGVIGVGVVLYGWNTAGPKTQH